MKKKTEPPCRIIEVIHHSPTHVEIIYESTVEEPETETTETDESDAPEAEPQQMTLDL